jgi:hypothetical protein
MTFNPSTLYAVSIGSSPSWLGQIMSQQVNDGVKLFLETGSGNFDSQFAAILEAEPTFGFSTRALETALGLIGINGYHAVSAGKFKLYFKKLALGALGASGSVHTSITPTDCFIVPKQITAQQGQPAAISYEVHVIDTVGDGTEPVVRTVGSVALAGTTNHDEVFTVGEISIGATVFDSIQSITVDFGIQVLKPSGSGNVWPRWGSIIQRKPIITVKLIDTSILSQIPVSALALDDGAIVKFRQGVKGGIVGATGITLTAAAGMAYFDSGEGSEGKEAEFDIKICPTIESTNAILAVGTF